MRQVHYGLCNQASSGGCQFSHDLDQLEAEVLLGLKQFLAKDEAFLQQLEAEDRQAATAAAGLLGQQHKHLDNTWHQQPPLQQQQQQQQLQNWSGRAAAPAHMAVLLKQQNVQQQQHLQPKCFAGSIAAGRGAGDVATSTFAVANGLHVEHF
jgi:hypothetical protein